MQALRRAGQALAPRLGPALAAAPELQTAARGAATQAAAGAAAGSKPVVEKEFLVYRWDPDSAQPPKYDSYKVDINA